MTMRTLFCVGTCYITDVHYCSCQSPKKPQNNKYSTENKRKIIGDLLEDYVRYVAPSNKSPLLVRLQFYILGCADINELAVDFTLSYFMMLAWTDNRLYFRPEYYENISFLNLHPEQMGMIWRPDIFTETKEENQFPNYRLFLTVHQGYFHLVKSSL